MGSISGGIAQAIVSYADLMGHCIVLPLIPVRRYVEIPGMAGAQT